MDMKWAFCDYLQEGAKWAHERCKGKYKNWPYITLDEYREHERAKEPTKR